MDIHFSDATATSVETGLLAIGVSTNDLDALPEYLKSIVGEFGTDLATAATNDAFTAKTAAQLSFATFGRLAAKRVMLVGTGDSSQDALRQAAGAVGLAARKNNIENVCLHFGAEEIGAIIEGVGAGNYKYQPYKNEDSKKKALQKVTLFAPQDEAAKNRALAVVAGQSFARDLVNAPAADIYPQTLAEQALSLSSEQLSVTIWDEEKIKAEKMGGIIGVGQGSSNPPRFIHMHYKPKNPSSRCVALVGKGVTFDAGGLSLKPSAGMLTMRCDMGGSAVVLGAMQVIRDLAPDVEVHGIVGAVENMCSANAYKLGDILTIRNGKTVEVHNTDAEGRLVLADCLSYATELKPDTIVDFATLTGACVVALGEFFTGLFTKDDALADQLLQSADNTGEGLWRMPLPDF